MKRGEGWIYRFTDRMNLPAESIPGVPLVEICGDRRVLIENHMGVTQYTRNLICVKVSYGILSVQGKQLELARMNRDQLVICGRVDCVRLHAKREGEK